MECTSCFEGYFITPFKFCSNSIRNCYTIGKYGCNRCRAGFKRSSNHFGCIDCKSDSSCSDECISSLVDKPPEE